MGCGCGKKSGEYVVKDGSGKVTRHPTQLSASAKIARDGGRIVASPK